MSVSFYPTKNRHAPTRAHDYLYDPTFTFATAKDFYKHSMVANLRMTQYEVSPVFDTMFSDLPSMPRTQLAVRQGAGEVKNIPVEWHGPHRPQIGKCGHQPSTNFTYADIMLYVRSPIIRISPDIIPDHLSPLPAKKVEDKKSKNKAVQTMYRESSAQTTPWQTMDYIIKYNSDPEILKLNFLRDNLPAGMHEIELIKRARRKRAWEGQIPEDLTEESLMKRRNVIEAIETDQWAFREQEIMDIQNLRMTLLEKMLQELLDLTADRAEKKLNRISKRLHEAKNSKILKLKSQTNRELRRLERQYKGINTKYHKVPILEEYKNYTSEMYAPLIRHGVDPKRGNEEIDHSNYQAHLIDIENMSTMPRWIDTATNIKDKVKLPGRHLCIRETKWTEPVLKQLHNELKNLRVKTKVKCTLRKRIIKIEVHHETFMAQAAADLQEKQNKAILLLQSVIRGRATQSMIYEGRDRCRELIVELQNTFPLQEEHARRIHKERVRVMFQQREQQVTRIKADNLNEMLQKLQGTIVGTLLDFLSKEHRRLLDERKAHAMALIHERERRDKEAAEAGRRQVEERRRSEHDEIFKQIMKVHQDTVDLYLQDIITEGIETVSEDDAKNYVKMLANQIYEEEKKEKPLKYIEKKELVADMMHHFIIPEIEKTANREMIRQKQKIHLKNAHDTIFNTIPTLNKSKDEDLAPDVGGIVTEPYLDDSSCECNVLENCDPRLLFDDPKLNIIK